MSNVPRARLPEDTWKIFLQQLFLEWTAPMDVGMISLRGIRFLAQLGPGS